VSKDGDELHEQERIERLEDLVLVQDLVLMMEVEVQE